MISSDTPPYDGQESVNRGLALIVDDAVSNRMLLNALLRQSDFEVIEAENGEEAIHLFQEHKPDLVLMDVMMPGMDGYEATRHIKRISQEANIFVPVIFLTALTDEDALGRGIQAGGDDFLSKPFSPKVLAYKIRAMERIRELQRKTARMYNQIQADQEIAKHVYNRVVLPGQFQNQHLHSLVKPTSLFSGDLFLSTPTPQLDLYLFLGDFTGHGLSASLGALPVSETFRAMTTKGFSLETIILTINDKLLKLLPTGLFLAGSFLHVPRELGTITVYNYGMPEILLRCGKTGEIKAQAQSKGFPLGIQKEIFTRDVRTLLSVRKHDSVILVSDGLLEAVDQQDEQFGPERLTTAIIRTEIGKSALENITDALSAFCGEREQADDVSLVEAILNDELFPQEDNITLPSEEHELTSARSHSAYRADIESTLLLTYPMLRKQSNPVPTIVSQLNDLTPLGEHRSTLLTIVSELFNNALDHGVLELSSAIKDTSEGFSRYYQEREERLGTLDAGYVKILLRVEHEEAWRHLHIRVEDSGKGFNFEKFLSGETAGAARFSGRGILLVKSLCHSLAYEESGRVAIATYAWREE